MFSFENGCRKIRGLRDVRRQNSPAFCPGRCSHHPVGSFCVAVETSPVDLEGNSWPATDGATTIASRTTQLDSAVILADQLMQNLGSEPGRLQPNSSLLDSTQHAGSVFTADGQLVE